VVSKSIDINRWYVGMVKDEILTRIVRECRHEAGLAVQIMAFANISMMRRSLRIRHK